MLALVGLPRGADSIIAAKRALRARVLAERRRLPDDVRLDLAMAACRRVIALPEVASARVVAAYAGTGTELPTASLLAALVDRGAVVLLPVLRDDDTLAWGRYDGTLVPGRRGLLEPHVADAALSSAGVAVVPGVAFDETGRRLGRGGGSFDRALAAVPDLPAIGIARDEEVVDEVPVAPHDRPVGTIVTPTRVIRVRPRW